MSSSKELRRFFGRLTPTEEIVVVEALTVAAEQVRDVSPRIAASLERIDASLQAIRAQRQAAQRAAIVHDLNYHRLISLWSSRSG